MKKGLLFILLAAASVCLPAQEKENAAKSYRVETNRFGANWFISGGVGAQMYFGDNDGKADFGKRLAPALDIAVGKWFTPGIGLRLAYNGLQAKGAAPSADARYAKGGTYSNGYYKQKWNMANFHGDVLYRPAGLLFLPMLVENAQAELDDIPQDDKYQDHHAYHTPHCLNSHVTRAPPSKARPYKSFSTKYSHNYSIFYD